MKKFLLIITVFTMLLLVGCNTQKDLGIPTLRSMMESTVINLKQNNFTVEFGTTMNVSSLDKKLDYTIKCDSVFVYDVFNKCARLDMKVTPDSILLNSVTQIRVYFTEEGTYINFDEGYEYYLVDKKELDLSNIEGYIEKLYDLLKIVKEEQSNYTVTFSLVDGINNIATSGELPVELTNIEETFKDTLLKTIVVLSFNKNDLVLNKVNVNGGFNIKYNDIDLTVEDIDTTLTITKGLEGILNIPTEDFAKVDKAVKLDLSEEIKKIFFGNAILEYWGNSISEDSETVFEDEKIKVDKEWYK